MNSNDIIRMARDAGFEVNFDIMAVSVDGVHINKELQRFAKAAFEAGAAAQREESAKLAQEMIDAEYPCDDFAQSIRLGMMRLCTDGRPKRLKVSMEVAAAYEECAQICDAYGMPDGTSETAAVLARAIRMKGKML